MIIIRIIGGLGNQLFQYALYKEFESKGADVRADLSLYERSNSTRPYCLGELGLSMRIASKEEIRRLCGDDSSFINKVIRKTFGRNRYFKEKFPEYYPELTGMKDKYLNGYWQNEAYFSSAVETIRREICFPVHEEELNNETTELIMHKNTTSVHVRLGDYEDHSALGGVCTKEYYTAAQRYIRSRVGDTEFIVFSDDIEKAKWMFGEEHFHYIRYDKPVPDYVDMYLMSKCSHNIIANSTFSWWAAWLNGNENKIVVAPRYWLKNGEGSDISCCKWVTIDNR